jgi:toxin ParE1/3/4
VSCKIIIRPEAEADMAEQFDWYEGRKKGLGYDFLAEIRSVLGQIEENPLRHA